MDYTNREQVLDKVKRSALALKKATLFQDDDEVVLTAVKACGMAIEFASDRIKQTRRDIVEVAVSNFGRAIIRLPEYHNDFEMVALAYENDPDIIKYFKDNSVIMRQFNLYEYQKKIER